MPLKFGAGVEPLLLGDVATVGIGHSVRTGAATEDGGRGRGRNRRDDNRRQQSHCIQ